MNDRVETPVLSIVIVNYNSGKFLKSCLRSVYQKLEHLSFEVIVVDNGSIDSRVEIVPQEFPAVEFLYNEKNLGFAKAVNQGIQASQGRYILLVNPDVVFLNRSFSELVQFMDQHPRVGIIGPRVYDDESRQSVQLSCRGFPSLLNYLFSRYSPLTRLFPNNRFSKRFLMTDWDHDKIRAVDWVSGCCMLIRKELLNEIGSLDEAYTLFFEDVDICYRTHEAGWKVMYYPKAGVVHYVGKSRAREPLKAICNRYKSMKHFYNKHYRKRWLEGLPIGFAIYMGMILLLIVAVFKNAIMDLRRKAR